MSSLCLALALLLMSCGNPAPEQVAQGGSGKSGEAKPEATSAAPTIPPFAVTGELEGLLLVWYDAEGPHTAARRSEVPEPSREAVRIDSLEVAPDKRLDPEHVYVADLRAPLGNGSYRVTLWERERFEAEVAPRGEVPKVLAAAPVEAGVTLYGASWCGACAQAKQFLASRGVPFVEKDIEKEPGAREEMMSKARAQGVRTGGIPMIDVRGKLLPGFDPNAILQALQRGS